MLVRRKKRPSGVTRGSLSILKTGPLIWLKRRHFRLAHVGIRIHGAQFVHHEGPPILAAALLAEERWAGRSELDPDRGEENDRRQENQTDERADAVHHAFDEERPGDFRRRAKDEHRAAAEDIKGRVGRWRCERNPRGAMPPPPRFRRRRWPPEDGSCGCGRRRKSRGSRSADAKP